MSWTNRVVWQEGMFLRTQHFQQQDRWTESLVRGVTRALRPHPWGLIDYTVDRDLLGTGRFALSSASGMFDDGTPGELFVTMAKEGSTISGFADAFAQAISYALQYGVPLQALVDKFSHVRFEPSGMTKNP